MGSNPPTRPNHLEPSPLGTKEYWDSLYTTELHNHSADTSDIGTIWFSDSGAEDKVLSFLSSHILSDKKLLGPKTTRQNCSFLDLGTGNGHFLLRLRGLDEDGEVDEEGEKWEGRMLGVDYSAQSVDFARRIAASKGVEIEFEYFDLMSDSPSSILTNEESEGWDVVLDKGTFDAISLSEERDGQGRRLCEGYREKVMPLVRQGGLLLVTSCNWTGEELRGWFAGA
ncbi:Protein-lysine N-methyltransferase, partial [Lachnellula subtilissima]